MNRNSETAIGIWPEALLDSYYCRAKEHLEEGLFSIKQVEEFADLLTELVNRKKEEQESGEQEG